MSRDGRGQPTRLTAVVVAVCGLALALSLDAAVAHKVKYPTNTNLKIKEASPSTATYEGKITSTKPKCVRNRTVNVLRAGVVVATTTSLANGDWSVVGPLPTKGETIVAQVTRKVLRKNKKHRHKCAPTTKSHKANP